MHANKRTAFLYWDTKRKNKKAFGSSNVQSIKDCPRANWFKAHEIYSMIRIGMLATPWIAFPCFLRKTSKTRWLWKCSLWHCCVLMREPNQHKTIHMQIFHSHQPLSTHKIYANKCKEITINSDRKVCSNIHQEKLVWLWHQ